MDIKKSFFMHDENGTSKKESLVDFFLSWTVRCITNKERDYQNPKLEAYCKCITSLLLFGDVEKLNQYEVQQVKTWLQWKRVDLCAEFYLLNKETQKEEKYALLLENKVYTSIHDNQLENYKLLFQKDYEGENTFLEYVYFSCKDTLSDWEKEQCAAAGYRAYTMDEILDLVQGDQTWDFTGNALFDEFWLSTWG